MPVAVDIIILSYAKSEQLKNLTIQAVETVLASENPQEIQFNVLVIESNKTLQPYQYENTITIYPTEEFGFNKYLNIGIKRTSSPYICLCNNDLIFHKGWATEILNVFNKRKNIDSANPYCTNFKYDERIINGDNVILRNENLTIDGILTGWCIFVKRRVFDKIGLLDERFTFWYSDNDYDLTLRKYSIKHALIKSSVVTHLACQSHNTLDDKREELTTGQRLIFEQKWHKPGIRNYLSRIRSALKKPNKQQ